MQLFFTPNHVQLLNSCYPQTSALLTAGPDFAPNSQELSRLTYYASNHPSKLNKLASELEKRLRVECRKARAGNTRSRVSLLISLSIFRSLATECRHNLALISPALIASLQVTLSGLSSDLEVAARAASVFAAWTTYTDGHLIGTDSTLTQDYLSVLRSCADLSCSDHQDHEVRNRTRLIGFQAVASALNSEALYNDSRQFKSQVAVIMRPILINLVTIKVDVLEEEAEKVKENPTSPYLSEFRTRPVIERRAASIHIHVDGEKGPSTQEVSSACLRALFSLLEHVNGAQLGFIMKSSFENLDSLKLWGQVDHCCWFARKTAEWAQYQYRYAVSTWLVERLVESQDVVPPTAVHHALAAMVTTVFESPTPLINLSTSDVMSGLMTLVIRRTAIDPEDPLLPALVGCMSSLGRHVYYSDQIQDLTVEITNRLSMIETQGSGENTNSPSARSQAIRCLLAGMLGLIHGSEAHQTTILQDAPPHRTPASPQEIDAPQTDDIKVPNSNSRTRVSPDIWQESLSLLCDADYAVRADYADALVYFLKTELPPNRDKSSPGSTDNIKKARIFDDSNGVNLTALLQVGDVATQFLSALHAYAYILASSPSLGLRSARTTPSPSIHASNAPQVNILPATPDDGPQLQEDDVDTVERRGASTLRPRKVSVAYRLMEHAPSRITAAGAACLSDYAHLLDILVTVQEQLPVRGLIIGVPMLLALHGAAQSSDIDDPPTVARLNAIRLLLTDVWRAIGNTWEIPELLGLCEKALLVEVTPLPKISHPPIGECAPPRAPVPLPSPDGQAWVGVNAEAALMAVVSSKAVQDATGLDKPGLLRRFSIQWTAENALNLSLQKPSFDLNASIRGDAISPLLKISPALMHIENISMQSLARATRGVGVTDLREALGGRSSMSNPALSVARPGSVSTFDHTSLGGDSRLTRPRSRTKSTRRKAPPTGPGEVRDVLNRLGIGKQNGSLLKASFPVSPKSDSRFV